MRTFSLIFNFHVQTLKEKKAQKIPYSITAQMLMNTVQRESKRMRAIESAKEKKTYENYSLLRVLALNLWYIHIS